MLTTIHHFNDEHVQSLHNLYQQEWWSADRSLEQTYRCLQGSTACLGIVDEYSELCGFARVLSDGVFKALIFDVIIRSDMRSKGLGQRLIQEIKGLSALKDVQHFELYCLPELTSFYNAQGFSEDVSGVRLMRHHAPD